MASEPTRTCSTCNGQKTVVKTTARFNSKGKAETSHERITCPTCNGAGVR